MRSHPARAFPLAIGLVFLAFGLGALVRTRGTAPPAGSPPFCSSPLGLESSAWQSCGDGTATAPSAAGR